MEYRKLGELVSIVKGKKHNNVFETYVKNLKRYIQIEDLRNNQNPKYTTDDGVEVDENDIIIAWDGANAGTIGFNINGFIGSTLARLRLKTNDVYPNYLGQYLKGQSAYIRENCYGATIPHVSKSFLESIKIPLPPLPIQKKIAEVLERADAAREKRCQANALTEQFLQSVFLEMFGDPVRNPRGWEKVSVGDLYEVQLGKMLDKKQYTGKNLKPYLRNINVQWGEFNLQDIKEMDFSISEFEKFRLRRGDILVCEGGEVGRCAIWNEEIKDCCYQKALHRLRPLNDRIDSDYFIYFMRIAAQQGLLVRDTAQVTIAHLTAERFREIKILIPPREHQHTFSQLVKKIESIKLFQRNYEEELDNLFQSLMQKAFKGELQFNEKELA
jgi:type I restriction enzyme, S subunit